VRQKLNVLYQKHAVDATQVVADTGTKHAELSERKAYEVSEWSSSSGKRCGVCVWWVSEVGWMGVVSE
jgi:hypothetical protein